MSTGQRNHWQKNHKRICKLYSSFSASLGSLPEHSRMDAILLSHLLAQMTPDDLTTDSSPVQTLLSLLPSPQEENPAPPVCHVPQFVPSILVQTLFVRFQSNNFALHSHLSTFGHGIFPLASRLFNHSCVPNAAARYILRPREPVKMEVMALRPILAGEEVSLVCSSICITHSTNAYLSADLHSICRPGASGDAPADIQAVVRV